jgi:hypothetical protein
VREIVGGDKGIMPCWRLIQYKRATIARRYRSFYDNSRSCGAAKNLRILAQLKHELTKSGHFLHFYRTNSGIKGQKNAFSLPL